MTVKRSAPTTTSPHRYVGICRVHLAAGEFEGRFDRYQFGHPFQGSQKGFVDGRTAKDADARRVESGQFTAVIVMPAQGLEQIGAGLGQQFGLQFEHHGVAPFA